MDGYKFQKTTKIICRFDVSRLSSEKAYTATYQDMLIVMKRRKV